MGSAFELLLVHDDQNIANELLSMGIAEIKRIEDLLSEFKPESVTSAINSIGWKEPLAIDAECFNLIERCIAISKLSKGHFDISVKPLKNLYSFKNTGFEMPDSSVISCTLQNVGYQNIIIDKGYNTVKLKNQDTKISFSAIGKGYASDMVKKFWQDAGVKSGFINASGDLNAFGSKADGTPWKIGIADPDKKSGILIYIPLHNASVATSGDYEQFFMHNNIRYSHNINPLTGMPVTGIKSVTVFSPGAELSDALATAVYVMGVKKGLDFVHQLPQTHCVIIDDHNKISFSNKMQYEEAVI